MIDWSATDALVFDMDGTLWDAVDSYCEVWNVGFRRFGIERTVTRDELIACMGLSIGEIYRRIICGAAAPDEREFLAFIESEEKRLMPLLGGTPYPGVKDGIRRLSEAYQVFLLSNCGESGLTDMMRHVGITPYVKEAVTYGATLLPKSENLKMLKAKHSLRQPVYVGDTQGDCNQTRLADMPFVYAAYGFGDCTGYDKSVDLFQELVDFFMDIKNEDE